MGRARLLTFVIFAAGCGLDIVGTATTDAPDASKPTVEASTIEPGQPGPDGDVPDASPSTDAAANDANPCASCPAQTLCIANVCQPTRRVFVTSASFDGDLGGQAGADAKCMAAATTAKLGGTWLAWVTVAGNNAPQNRFSKPDVPYRLLDGTQIAANSAELLPATMTTKIDHPIDRDENNDAMDTASTTEVWTGTTVYGFGSGANCTDWTSNQGTASSTVGSLIDANGAWTDTGLVRMCNKSGPHLYCFEQ